MTFDDLLNNFNHKKIPESKNDMSKFYGISFADLPNHMTDIRNVSDSYADLYPVLNHAKTTCDSTNELPIDDFDYNYSNLLDQQIQTLAKLEYEVSDVQELFAINAYDTNELTYDLKRLKSYIDNPNISDDVKQSSFNNYMFIDTIKTAIETDSIPWLVDMKDPDLCEDLNRPAFASYPEKFYSRTPTKLQKSNDEVILDFN